MDSSDPVVRNPTGKYLVFFDGHCNLCNRAVNFLLDRDPYRQFLFASLQSGIARRFTGKVPLPEGSDSMVVISPEGQLMQQGQAALALAARLPWPWKALTVFKIFPRGLTDRMYHWIASHRYRWFGRRELCRMPDPGLSDRFLSDDL